MPNDAGVQQPQAVTVTARDTARPCRLSRVVALRVELTGGAGDATVLLSPREARAVAEDLLRASLAVDAAGVVSDLAGQALGGLLRGSRT